MLRAKTIDAAGCCLNVFGEASDSDAPWLLMLHGVNRNWRDFSPLLGSLLPCWRIGCLDFRGHGQSLRADSYYVVDYIADALAAIDCLPGPVAIYGHSLGAMVAAGAAAPQPRVCGIILEDPPFDTMGERIAESSLKDLFRGMQSVAGETDVQSATERLGGIEMRSPNGVIALREVRDGASLRFSARCLANVDPDVLTSIVAGRWLKGYDRPGILRSIACPALVLQADVDAGGMLTDQQAAELVDQMDECHVVKFNNAGHLIHWTHTQDVLRLSHNFLESLR